MKTFKGGVRLPEHKEMSLSDTHIKRAKLPAVLTIPLQQHIGSPSKAIVKTGDSVCVGSKIAEPGGFVSAAIHSSVSGKVKAIDIFPHPILGRSLAVQIESDGKDTLAPGITEDSNWKNLTPDEIRLRVRDAGVVGMGGAMFPAHVKFMPLPDKEIDTVIINGAECEPYLTADHVLMLAKPAEIIAGAEIIMRAVGAKRCIIAIEDNKLEALELINSKLFGMENKPIKTVRLKVKYPQGAEKQLIKTVLNREVPRGGLPLNAGIVVSNVGTVTAVYDAVRYRKPLYERVVTVTGTCVAHAQNFLVRIGTPISQLLGECATLRPPMVVITGGPMMGVSQVDLDIPVIKGTTGVVTFPKTEVRIPVQGPCIRCGRCVRGCPMRLVPSLIQRAAEKERFEEAEEWGAMDCMECGVCAYNCPSKIPLVQLIRWAKAEILARRALKKPNSEKSKQGKA
ncbi:MAG: electron transport complex subunit RsxC [Candidatus Omnitrophica bacterium]|nr:electron transport complex subunit RsxC [Candidatus Omnitrophota bacterium]